MHKINATFTSYIYSFLCSFFSEENWLNSTGVVFFSNYKYGSNNKKQIQLNSHMIWSKKTFPLVQGADVKIWHQCDIWQWMKMFINKEQLNITNRPTVALHYNPHDISHRSMLKILHNRDQKLSYIWFSFLSKITHILPLEKQNKKRTQKKTHTVT